MTLHLGVSIKGRRLFITAGPAAQDGQQTRVVSVALMLALTHRNVLTESRCVAWSWARGPKDETETTLTVTRSDRREEDRAPGAGAEGTPSYLPREGAGGSQERLPGPGQEHQVALRDVVEQMMVRTRRGERRRNVRAVGRCGRAWGEENPSLSLFGQRPRSSYRLRMKGSAGDGHLFAAPPLVPSLADLWSPLTKGTEAMAPGSWGRAFLGVIYSLF